MPNAFDLIVRNGSVIDGTGAPAFAADVGVRDGRIAEVGAIPIEAETVETIDAAGYVVCPGFIDIHTHADISLLARPDHLPKVMQGVTTEVFTNCGLGFAPINDRGMEIQRRFIAGIFGAGENQASGLPVDWSWRTVADLLARFESGGVATNVAYLVPHGSVRVSVMGMEERPATATEVEAMRAMVAEGMEQGAWGLSTGIWYSPMRAADMSELVTLCREAGFFATHQRDYGDAIFEATRESLSIAEEARVPVQIAHLQMNGPRNADRASDLLGVLEEARGRGVDVTCDTYPYTAGSTFIQSLLPEWAAGGGPDRILERLADPRARAKIVSFLDGKTDWDRFQLVGASSSANAPFEGERFDSIAARRGLPVPNWICAVLEEEQLAACYVHHAAHEGNVRTVITWEHQMIGSDGLHLPGKTHPRLYGTFPRVLGRYVREERVIPLDEAVRKMTSAPARRLGLRDRGELKRGFAADIVVFDPLTISDTATFEEPLRFPVGIPHVLVNGVAVKRSESPTHALPGQILRK